MFGGDKGPPTPPGIRMHGIFAASTGFSVQFFPESAILGCGPDAARAYPYTVEADGTRAVVKIDAPDHPLTLAFKSDGSLDPGATGPYQVHGRIVTGQDNNDDFTFAPMEQTCNLAVLTPSKTIPSRRRHRCNNGRLRRTPHPEARSDPAQPPTQAPSPLRLHPSATPLYPSSPDSPRNPALPILSPDVPTSSCATATPTPSQKAESPSHQEHRPTNTSATACVPDPEHPTAKRSGRHQSQTPPQPSAPTPTAAEPSPALPPEPTT